MNRPTSARLCRGALSGALALVLALSACGGGDEVEPPAPVAAHEDRAQAVAAGAATALSEGSPAVGSFQLASTAINGAAATASSTTCAVSADGSKVLFLSDATHPAAGDNKLAADLCP